MKSYTVEEVALHNKATDCWIIINGQVYDITKFLSQHPGGRNILLKVAGTDASAQFAKFHNVEATLKAYGDKLIIGTVSKKASKSSSSLKVDSAPALIDNSELGLFGELVPYGDPAWYQGRPSIYYTEKHIKLRRFVRQWTEENVMPHVTEWDENKKVPMDFFKKAADAGILSACVAAGFKDSGAPEDFGSHFPAGIPASEWDGFCSLIVVDEISRCGSGGFVWSLVGGLGIGLPPIMKFADEKLKKRIVPPCIQGLKNICLAITEPEAGSDVQNLKTTAVKSACGKFYIVNGEKKWITNGVFADYFTVAVRTGGEGMAGVSLLLVERGPGVTTKQMNCMGVWSSGTTYITFEDVKVPVENLVGKENSGFKYIMYNFNYERLGMCIQACRFSRVCYEEAYKYAQKRETFGKKLIDHQIIRFKLAEMARQIEAYQAQLELLSFQIMQMDAEESFIKLGGATALAKVQSSKLFEFCAREAAQIFGGLSYSRGGQGGKVERLYREVRAYAIPGGSEEILLDLGIRQQDKVSSKIRDMMKDMNNSNASL